MAVDDDFAFGINGEREQRLFVSRHREGFARGDASGDETRRRRLRKRPESQRTVRACAVVRIRTVAAIITTQPDTHGVAEPDCLNRPNADDRQLFKSGFRNAFNASVWRAELAGYGLDFSVAYTRQFQRLQERPPRLRDLTAPIRDGLSYLWNPAHGTLPMASHRNGIGTLMSDAAPLEFTSTFMRKPVALMFVVAHTA